MILVYKVLICDFLSRQLLFTGGTLKAQESKVHLEVDRACFLYCYLSVVVSVVGVAASKRTGREEQP